MLVRDVMSTKVVTIDPKATVRDAAELMRAYGIGTLVVVEDDYPVGIITERDITFRVVARDVHPSISVEEVMSTDLITVDEDTPLVRALETMRKYNFRRLPVLRHGRLVGIISIRDILKHPKLTKDVLRALAKVELW